MHYVGLSRVRNSSNLHILNLNEWKIKVSKNVAIEMNRLRAEATLVPLVSLQDVDLSLTTTIIFHDARSVYLYIDDIRSDYNVQKADVNIFVETRLCSSDSGDMFNISGFNIYRNDYNQSHTRSCYGSVVYLKNGFHCTELPYRFNFNDVEITIMVINQPIPNLHIIGIDHSETKVNMPNFIDVLNHLYNMKLSNPETPAILMGDFNVNLLEKTSEQQRLTT